MAENSCFGCGEGNPQGLRLHFAQAEDGTVSAREKINEGFHGHPGYVHGGVLATILDEAMSKAIRATGRTAVTRKLASEYLRPTPTETPLLISGKLLRVEGSKIWVEAKIENERGKCLVRGEGLFIEVNPFQ